MGTLILSRRISETLCIGDDIRITVLDVRGTQVRLGITAPKAVPVHRQEIYERIKGAKEPERQETGETDQGSTIEENEAVVVVVGPRRRRLAGTAR